MKKHIFLFVIAVLSSLQVMGEEPATLPVEITDNMNPFAYNLKAELSNDNRNITISYCLNANATSVKIVFLNGETCIKEYECPETLRTKTVSTNPYIIDADKHSVTISTEGLPLNQNITWRIDVQGSGRTNCGLYKYDGVNTTYSFDLPSSVDIVKDPTSGNYGKVIVVEASHIGYNNNSLNLHSKEKGAGLYVFNPDVTPIADKHGKFGFNGGTSTWGKDASSATIFANTTWSPRRVRVSEDGRIFVSSMHGYDANNKYINGDILWEVDSLFTTWTTVIGDGVGGAKYNISTYELTASDGTTYIAAPNAGLDVRGKGENLKLLLLSCNANAFANNQGGFQCYEYNLGTKTTWSEAPSKNFRTNSYTFVHPRLSNVQYDKEGGIWCVSHRSDGNCTTNQPGLVHKTSDVVEDNRQTRSDTKNAALRFNRDFTQAMMAGSENNGVWYKTYDPDNPNNTATLGFFFHHTNIDMTAVGGWLNDFAWDNANNIYAVGQKTDKGGKGDGHLAVYCLPYSASDVFTTPGPNSFILAKTICWHPYPAGYEVTNEDLWETFQSDYNDWYMYHESATQKVNTKKAHQSITNAYSFTFPSDKTPQGGYEHPDGLVSDFLTNNVSKWKWLGDYIKEVANPTTVPANNEELWAEFKLYYNIFYGENRSDQPITEALTFMTKGKTILTEASSKYKWLGDYIISVAAQQQITIGSGDYDNESTYRNFLKAFLNKEHLENYWDGIANKRVYPNVDFTEAGDPENWKPYYVSPEGKNQIDTEMEWRREVHAFFNQAKTCTYKNTNGETVTDNTGDYTTAGQPAQWHNEWWNATFKPTMEAYPSDSLPTIRRKGYVLSGWYYGNDDGYSLNDREATKGITREECLWARWLETCLYEGYITGSEKNSAASEEMGKQINRNIEFINVMQGKSDYQMDIDRKLQGGTYNTFVIPFAISKDENAYNYIGKIVDAESQPLLTGNTSIRCFEGSEIIEHGEGEYILQLNFAEWEDQIAANQPILIMPENDITEPMHTTWPPYISSAAYKLGESDPYITFTPVLAPTEVQGGVGTNNFILVADNRLARLSSTGTMLGLRGYFNGSQIPDNLAPQQMIIKITEKDGVVTYLDNIDTPQQGAAAIKIMQNGTIYILRDGKVYDVMGRQL